MVNHASHSTLLSRRAARHQPHRSRTSRHRAAPCRTCTDGGNGSG
jgi:hypothetical protein